jgi:nucleoside-diphosphate-sugar epimerase
VVELVGQIVGKKLEVTKDRGRFRPADSEVRKLQCDYTKAKNLLGYRPTYTLEKGLTNAVRFYRRYLADFSGKEYVV